MLNRVLVMITSAIRDGNAELVRVLLTLGANPRYALHPGPHAMTPMRWAAENNHPAVLSVLLQEGKVGANEGCPLMYAIRKNCAEAMHVLIEEGKADVNYITPGGWPLFAAVMGNKAEAVRILLRAGTLTLAERMMAPQY